MHNITIYLRIFERGFIGKLHHVSPKGGEFMAYSWKCPAGDFTAHSSKEKRNHMKVTTSDTRHRELMPKPISHLGGVSITNIENFVANNPQNIVN